MGENNFKSWLDFYAEIRDYFCNKCKILCTNQKKITCIEQYLSIAELWEIEKIYHSEDSG